jgi:chitinase
MSFSAPLRIAGVVTGVAIAATIAVVSPATAAPRRDRTPPTAPSNLRVTGLTMTSVTLAWNPSTDDSGVFSYVVNKDGQGFTVPQAQTSYTIDWLSPGQTYRFFVTAVDRALNRSAPSNTVTVTTPRDTTPPTAPVLTATVRRPSQVSLTWTKSTDDVSPFVTYGVLVNGARATQHVNW